MHFKIYPVKYVKGLDVLRAFAAFFVIISHFSVWFDKTSPSGKFIHQVMIPGGRFGVNLFFVLSGFLITAILLNARHEAFVSRATIIKNFFIRRSLRIFPIYFLLLFFLYAIDYPDIRQYFPYFATYTANLIPYQTDRWNMYCHTWTLAIEEQFYLLWPWLIIYINPKYMRHMFIAMIMIGVASTYIGMFVQHHMEPFLVHNHLDSFGLGGLFAWIQKDSKDARKMSNWIQWLALPTIAVIIYWRICFMNGAQVPTRFLMKTANSIIALYLINRVVHNKSMLVERFVLNNRALNYVGKISYGIYLYHLPYVNYFCWDVNRFLYDITLPYPTLNAIIHDHHVDYWIQVAIMIGIAALSYHLIEYPILRLKRYFNYNKQAVPEVATRELR